SAGRGAVCASRSKQTGRSRARVPLCLSTWLATAARHAQEAHNPGRMRISAKVDYALRACTELAVAGDGPTKGDRIAAAQAIPIKFLENILSELRNAGIVATQRGVEGGYWLARPAEEITIAEVMRALEGPLANVRGHRPETLAYEGSAHALV